MLRSAAASKPAKLEKSEPIMRTDSLGTPPRSKEECAGLFRPKFPSIRQPRTVGSSLV